MLQNLLKQLRNMLHSSEPVQQELIGIDISHNYVRAIQLTKKNKIGNLLIGGYSDLKYLFDLVYKKKYNHETVNIIRNKYNYSKKTTLRIIELINNIN